MILKKQKEYDLLKMKKQPLVSINIPTFNSERTMRMCLEAVKNQTYKNIELIIVDSYSTDKTLEIVKEFGAKVYSIKGLITSRILGIQKSKGEYILLLDSDQIMDKEMIKECVEKASQGYEAIILPEISIYDKTLISKIIAYNMYTVQADKDVNHGTALPRFIKAEYLKKIKNVPEYLGYFDHVFIYNELVKMDAKTDYVNSKIFHYELNTWSGVIKKFYKRYGKVFIPSLQYNKKLIVNKSLPRRAFFSRRAFKNPIMWCGMMFLYSVKATAALFGIASYLIDKIFE